MLPLAPQSPPGSMALRGLRRLAHRVERSCGQTIKEHVLGKSKTVASVSARDDPNLFCSDPVVLSIVQFGQLMEMV